MDELNLHSKIVILRQTSTSYVRIIKKDLHSKIVILRLYINADDGLPEYRFTF